VPCWDKECETLYRYFTRAPVGTDSDRAASSLLSRHGQKKQERWEEAVISIDFSHCSRKAWRTINKLIGILYFVWGALSVMGVGHFVAVSNDILPEFLQIWPKDFYETNIPYKFFTDVGCSSTLKIRTYYCRKS